MVGAGLAGVVVAAVVAVVVGAVAGAGWWGPGWRGWLARRRAQASCWRRPVVWWPAPPRGPVPATSPSSVPPPPRSNSISSRTYVGSLTTSTTRTSRSTLPSRRH
uniref:Uncharacterized protein n=1 Tax=Oryza rufipogon TaxID=4529 RepID=A0A0E0RAM0_ORYRU